jgi:Mg2+/Co2+ transporter CorB
MLITVGAIVLLLILSAFFSGSETALTVASRPLMHHLAQNGDRRAMIVNQLRKRADRLIGTILLGNNLVNIMASALATSLMISLFGEVGVAYAAAGMTLLVFVFGEIIPKTYAFHRANALALRLARLVRLVVRIFSPAIIPIHAVINGAFRLFGANPDAQRTLGPSSDELRGAIELHACEGRPVQQERAMLRSILDLTEVEVAEIMIHRKNVSMIDAEAPLDVIVGQVQASPYSRIPLWLGNPDNIVGVIHAKALLRAVRWSEGKLEDIDVMALAAKPWFVPDSTTLLDQLQAFRRRREHFALVVDEYGTFMGIVTLEDILEEIVGDIVDEHDIPAPGVVRQPDGSYIVQGSVTIRDLNRRFDWSLPDEDAATIAGLVLHEARRIPEVGQAFMFHGMRFEILRRHRHQITSIRITPREDAAESVEARSLGAG